MSERCDKAAKELNILLKEVKNEKDFNNFTRKMKSYGCDSELYGKRRGYYLFNFVTAYNPKKVAYLVDDGKSTGLCRWENLWKVAKVR